jgi:hypothetical protein
VLLAVAHEPALAELYLDAKARGLRAIRFHEPDLGDALTAIALEPAARKLVTRLPLALCLMEGGEKHDRSVGPHRRADRRA